MPVVSLIARRQYECQHSAVIGVFTSTVGEVVGACFSCSVFARIPFGIVNFPAGYNEPILGYSSYVEVQL